MIQITWVEILLAGWLAATLALSVGYCLLNYRRFMPARASDFPGDYYAQGLQQPSESAN